LNLIGRYIFREVLTSTAIVIAVLLLIFMSNQFAETLGDAAADALPRDAVFEVFGLQLVQTLGLLAPIALLLGVLLALARFNRDSEMAALAACGVGPGRLLRPIGLLSLLIAVGVGWLAVVEVPAAARAIEEIRFEAQEEMELGALTPGRFTAIDAGTAVIYARDSDDDLLQGVFIYGEVEERVVVVLAEEGEGSDSEESGELGLVLRNGRRYDGVPGEAAFSVTEFREHMIPIRIETREFERAIETRSTRSLLSATDPESRAELQWRIATPVSILILALLAVPLSRSSPREGRYARVGLGLLIYIIYANMLAIARVWVEREAVPVWLGTWWVHAGLALFAISMLMHQSRFGKRQRPQTPVEHEPVG